MNRVVEILMQHFPRHCITSALLEDLQKANLVPAEQKDNKFCYWSRADEDTDMWETSCEQAFCLDEGTPKENDFKFCVYCGKPLVES